jgi:hypothetical protein
VPAEPLGQAPRFNREAWPSGGFGH